MILKKDCRYFFGDKPCKFHKETGVKCDECKDYQPIRFRILIIKLDAVGDVLRTTSILHPLKKKYPDCYILWCTRQDSAELFINNSLVDEILIVGEDALVRISAEEFNLVINLDSSKISSAIASGAIAENKSGFILNKKGFVEATSAVAQQWLEMSAFDDVKKANNKTYQQIIYEILDLDLPVHTPIIQISDSIRKVISQRNFIAKIDKNKPVIGLNVGVGTKWPSKGWPVKRWKELVEKFKSGKYNLLLLGGPEETGMIKQLTTEYNYLVDTGCANSLLEFATIVDLCAVIITADTLALHVATALEKKIIALFGPTSANEIELYGKGIKLTSDDECKCYYRKYCSEEVSCMEKISAEMVGKTISSLIE